ncbi:ferric reductase [Microlunatus endophyticus]|uniref:Ferric reductase n=1 Tax=Microlunatus endophyticus TaxID=1716077 RepID=A0A917S9Z5_9ACTN|nr:ferric reductase-like transmembrane domain-containing protein [Microlunatus endophyticus]GGL64075.1 ferric reductase [Microlunatus endophyticus]
MTLAVRAVAAVLAYVGVVLAPLVFAAIGATDPGYGFWTNFSVALAFVGLAMMGLEFVLVARFKPVAAPFGQDALLQFHRQIGFLGLAFVIIHIVISINWGAILTFRAPAFIWVGVAAAAALVVLVITSVWRKRLRIPYEVWHVVHTLLALVLVVGALVHVYLVNQYLSSLWKQLLWGLMSAAFLALIGWVRVIKPWTMRSRAWQLVHVGQERGQTTTLRMAPPAGEEFRFDPGQFAWFVFNRSPFSLTSHPFSLSSSAEQGEIEIAVKALGDFTSAINQLQAGSKVYVDGPHGVFSMDQDEGPGFCFIGGGVGITGLLSMLRTMADREDARKAILIYANRDWESVAFREEIERLEKLINLTTVHVLTQAAADWTGERGYVDREMLSRHLPKGYRRFQYFICGPDPMMDAAEGALLGLGVPTERVHTERFNMV